MDKRKVQFHCNHPLELVDLEDAVIRLDLNTCQPHNCNGCGIYHGRGYYCHVCMFGAHMECIDIPDIINHPCHSRHPLKKVSIEKVDYTDGKCHFCRDHLGGHIYHCSICNFSIDLECWINKPPLTIHRPKSHEHTFTLMARKDSFTCNACGMVGDRNPYVCLTCNFMLHLDCTDLPRIIDINRHEHRISRTYHLGHGDWECGVCRKKIDWTFGAFSCLRCSNYAVHSKCATRRDVWDGKELEDEPEEEEEESPYKVINEKEIIHFSHDHTLTLGDDNATNYEKMWCDACILPINSGQLFFKCVECKFSLHKVCASLPRRKRNILHKHKLDLHVKDKGNSEFFKCNYCHKFFDGFSYKCPPPGPAPEDTDFFIRQDKLLDSLIYRDRSNYDSECSHFIIDTQCGSIAEPFHHELHPHPLYRTSAKPKDCGACGKKSQYVLRCLVCKYALGMECATLPRKVKHRCDDHVLTLHHGPGNSNGQLWCDICEKNTTPSVWFYGCDDCGSTLHINCVLGDMYKFKAGRKYDEAELVANDGMSRPFCTFCKNRCIFPSFLKATSSDSTVLYACSMKCAYKDYPKTIGMLSGVILPYPDPYPYPYPYPK